MERPLERESAPPGALGTDGEAAAVAWYLGAGYTVLARNWRCPIGEIDIVLRRGGTLVFAEVKARSGVAFGGPYEAVTARKREKLRRLAQAFLSSHPAPWRAVRFDVASVTSAARGGTSVHVFEDAF